MTKWVFWCVCVWTNSSSLFSAVAAFLSNLTIQRQHFPSDEDQSGAAKALTRLLDTYQLDTNTISTGQIPGSDRTALGRDFTFKCRNLSEFSPQLLRFLPGRQQAKCSDGGRLL